MEKRGQLTIILILVVFIVLILGIVIYLSGSIRKTDSQTVEYKSTATTLDANPVQTYLDSLFSQVAQQGLDMVGSHGGYISTDTIPALEESTAPYSTLTAYGDIPYYITDQPGSPEIFVRPLKNIIGALRKYVVYTFNNVSNFTFFIDRGYNVIYPNMSFSRIHYNFSKANLSYSSSLINITVLMQERNVVFTMQYPVLIYKREAYTEISQFHESVSVPFASMYSNFSTLANDILAGPPPYDISLHCAKYNAFRWINTTVLDEVVTKRFAIIMKLNITPQYNYTFQFAVKGIDVKGRCP